MSTAPNSDGVLSLAIAPDEQRGRALLKAATEVFVFEPRHTRTEIAIYEELAMQLMRQTPLADRVAVAGLVAPHPDAPPAVLALLAADEPAVAAPVIAGAPVLDDVILLALVAQGSPAHLALIGARPGLSPALAEALVRTGDEAAAIALASNTATALAPDIVAGLAAFARGRPAVAAALGRRLGDVDDADLTDLFLDLDDRGRRRVIKALELLALRDFAARRPPPAAPRPDEETVAEFARASLSRDLDRQATLLGRLAALDAGLARRLLADRGGEPLAIVLRAAGLDEALATRVILFSGGADVRDYFEVKRLAELYRTLSLRSASLLVARWRGEAEPLPSRQRLRPQEETGTPVRPRETQPRRQPAASPQKRDAG